MRYAAPPLEDLRWRAPVEPLHTGTVEKATRFQPVCLGIGMHYPDYSHDEDCLFVNVWSPANATPRSKLPVWIFIQGGGYVSLSNANWNGAEVVQKSGHNIVMVNFNYRVGLWGFLASERVREDGDLNAGLLDQRMLMKWVKEHIASFGGDPDKVVIHGASAGAGSVAMHMVAYGGRNDNLFVGAMAESVFFPAQPFVPELEYQFDRVIRQTGCSKVARPKQIACLRSKDVAALQASNYAQPFPGRSQPPMPLFYWTPCIDGDFLRDLPYTLFRRGSFVDVPVLFGTDTDEGSLFAPNTATQPEVADFLANNYPKLTPNDTAAILALYSPPLPLLPGHAPWFPTASRAYGEATFTCPSDNVLNHLHAFTELTDSLFVYRYNVLDDDNLALGIGVPHLFEAAAIFGPDNIGPTAARPSYKTYNAPMVPVLMAYWISFVRTLDPNIYRVKDAPKWGVWGEDMERLVLETGNVRMESTPQDERARCQFWQGLGDVMEQKQ
ncbi:Alpha/Beta hydrolase protein [Lasiosphaeris hirsuta]|uniref:Carboxylic ester hydrolase n=1 Tax=Lasiosphaeris hirsuta TaxID=260670 RepID=A0AA40BAS0_9PEZI|nr:Alpha/Beta hydrolase protein [Lasiosphaeris hirsuta]